MSRNATTAAPRHGTAVKMSSRLPAADTSRVPPTTDERAAQPRCVVCRQPMTRTAPTQLTHPLCGPIEEDPQEQPAAAAPAPEVLDFARFTAHDWEVWHTAFVCGYLDGAAVQQAEDFAPIEAAARASVRRTAGSPDHATLCERRGNPARAQAVREHWRATGLVGGPA